MKNEAEKIDNQQGNEMIYLDCSPYITQENY